MSSQLLNELVTHLDEYLDIANIPDYPDAANGLQVENSGVVHKIAACTDACLATIDAAANCDADLMLVHHGLFWGDGLVPLTGRRYRRTRALLTHDLAVYSAHLPLDAHPEVGNNVELARLVELEVRGRFGDYEGHPIGVWGELAIGREKLAERLSRQLGHEPHVIATGPQLVRKVGIVTGGAADLISAAHTAGLDTFITGEGAHHNYFEAEELGLNVLYAGHYASETLGVKALAGNLADRFGLDWEFIDHPTGI